MIYKSDYPSVPIATEPFSKTFLEALWFHHLKTSKRQALINANDEKDSVSFGDLYLYCYSVASYLESKGFFHQDTCCLVLPNSWQFISILIGSSLQGGITSLASPIFTKYELQQQFKNSRCKIVFCCEANFDQVYKAVQSVPLVTTVVVVADNRGQQKPLNISDNAQVEVVRYENIINCVPTLRPNGQVNCNVEKDVFILPYSSGTTGAPKGVMISHKNFGTMMRIQNDHMGKLVYKHIDPEYDHTVEVHLLLLPFYHIFGIGVVLSRLLEGSTGVFMQGFDGHVFCATIQKYKVRSLLLVPPVLVFLAKSPIADLYDLSSVVFIFSGAAPAGRDLFIELKNKYKSLRKIAQGYGMTELSLGSVFPVLDDEKDRLESSGKLLPNYEMKICDITTGKEIGPNVPGELYFRSPTVMLGYLGRPEATTETINSEGWLKTGDVGYIDNDGFVFVIDRLKELIKVKGYQVPPAELEDLLLSHPKVKDCAVIGIPHDSHGELPKAYIVKADNQLTENDVMQYVKDRVAHYKQLKGGVEFIDEIPKSAAGKILRRFLRDKHKASSSEKKNSKI